MPFKPGPILVLASAFVALALVPGSMSSDAGIGEEAVGVAVAYVDANAAELGVTSADVTDLAVTSVYRSAHNAVTHVNLNQRYRGLEVFGAHATVNVAADGSVLFAAGSFVDLGGPAASAELDAVEAVGAAADGLDLEEPTRLRELRQGDGAAQETVVSDGGISEEPIPARLGWQPTDDGLRLAWQLVIDETSDVDLWNATVDAETGELLDADNWTSHASPNPVEDGSSYRVFEVPMDSPNDGDRLLVEEPADALASPYGWHDTDGAPGAEFTNTRGNNVHAYTDRDNNGQPDPGSDPDGGAGPFDLAFDFPLDLNEHAQSYTDAAVTNLFYWCNTIHDVIYRYGFDEASGNFQVNNYDRGGVGGDDVRCEAQDGGGQNNANFSTPSQDGGRPRMQMYLWPGAQFGLPNAVTIDSGPAAGTYLAQYARFTPAPPSAGIDGDIVRVDDGVDEPNDGCEPYALPAGDPIALVDDADECNFRTQVANAEDAGAVAVVIANTSGGSTPSTMSGSMQPPAGIPAVRVSAESRDALLQAGALPAPGSVHRNTDRPAIRDGDLDNGIIIHEYGHGISNRLVGGPTTNCISGQERMSEGWSDYYAISFLIDPELDDPDGPRGLVPYSLFQPNRQGNGLRPRPYSRDMSIQPATYESIGSQSWLNGSTLSTPHGVGHVWAAFLLDMTWDLIDKLGFNPDLYADWSTGGNNLAIQIVTDGLKFQGCGPTFVVGRDAIIASEDALTGGENACTLWASFARRGVGFSADDGGTTDRNDNEEAFDTHPACLRGFGSPVHAAYGDLNEAEAGSTVPLKFDGEGHVGLDVLASNSPYSRLVDCETLETVDASSPFVTPRPIPVATETPGNSGLSSNSSGVYHYNWKTAEEWAGTCRELVLTRKDGVQHRAFFRFTAS